MIDKSRSEKTEATFKGGVSGSGAGAPQTGIAVATPVVATVLAVGGAPIALPALAAAGLVWAVKKLLKE